LLNLRGEAKKSGEGNGRNMGGAITGDGDEDKKGDWHPPHVRVPSSPFNFSAVVAAVVKAAS